MKVALLDSGKQIEPAEGSPAVERHGPLTKRTRA
jgi:hypothetical protein